VIATVDANRAALETRLARQRRPPGDFRLAVEGDGGAVPVPLGIDLELLEHGGHVGRRRLLVQIAARKGQIGFEHPGHFIDVALDCLTASTSGSSPSSASSSLKRVRIVRSSNRPLAETLDLNRMPYLRVKFHVLHPSPSAESGREFAPAGFLLRARPNHPVASSEELLLRRSHP
jgi:hypothetical protein